MRTHAKIREYILTAYSFILYIFLQKYTYQSAGIIWLQIDGAYDVNAQNAFFGRAAGQVAEDTLWEGDVWIVGKGVAFEGTLQKGKRDILMLMI